MWSPDCTCESHSKIVKVITSHVETCEFRFMYQLKRCLWRTNKWVEYIEYWSCLWRWFSYSFLLFFAHRFRLELDIFLYICVYNVHNKYEWYNFVVTLVVRLYVKTTPYVIVLWSDSYCGFNWNKNQTDQKYDHQRNIRLAVQFAHFLCTPYSPQR